MTGTVKLRVVRGIPENVEYEFAGRAVGAIGRAEDCLVKLPSDLVHMDVSRHHCLLDIDPPRVRVRDLGSRNGTFVNGEMIGQRPRKKSAESAVDVSFPPCPVRTGDEIAVGGTVFRVEVSGPEATAAAVEAAIFG